jgi:hypothetical protein
MNQEYNITPAQAGAIAELVNLGFLAKHKRSGEAKARDVYTEAREGLRRGLTPFARGMVDEAFRQEPNGDE